MKANQVICVLLCCSILLASGCAGTAAHPINQYKYGDEHKSATQLRAEIAGLDTQITKKEQSIKKKNRTNVICFVTGFLVIVPWFFMDIKGSREVELDALEGRRQSLDILLAGKMSPNGEATEEETQAETMYGRPGTIRVGGNEDVTRLTD